MDRSCAISQLPAMHAVAVRLQEGGFGDSVIATALGTDPEQVPPLLRIAATKLARLLAEDNVAAIDAARRQRGESDNESRGGET